MPNYKNQLTHQIILKAFERYSSTRKQQYVELQMLYKTLCQMIKDNSKSRKDERVFDRDTFEQIMEQSVLVRDKNTVMVGMQSFTLNLMRAQILINQTLKSLHCNTISYYIQVQAMNIITTTNHQPSKDVITRLNEIKQEKEQSEQSLFCLRLTFFGEEELKILTKKMQENGSQVNYSIERVLRRGMFEDKQQKSNSQPIKANSSSYFKPIFVLTFILLILQSLSMIFYSNFTLNILLFGLIMSIFINRKYSKILVKLLLLVALVSIMVDLGFLYVHFRDIFYLNMSNMIEKRVIMRINAFCGEWFVAGLTGVILLTFLGKILLSIFLLMQLLQKPPTPTTQLSLFGQPLQLQLIPTPQQLPASQSLIKSFY